MQVKSLITGTDIHELSGHNSQITSLATTNDCERVYVACADSKLYLYNILSTELIAVLIEQESSINDLKMSADNSFLFSSSGVIIIFFTVNALIVVYPFFMQLFRLCMKYMYEKRVDYLSSLYGNFDYLLNNN